MSATEINPVILKASFISNTSPGPVSIPGLKVGDVMISLSSDDFSSLVLLNHSMLNQWWFEVVVTVDDELQQYDTKSDIETETLDISNATLTAHFLREGTHGHLLLEGS